MQKGRRIEREVGRGMEGRLTEGSGTGVSDEGAAFELRGRPQGWRRAGGGTRGLKLGREGTRRDARAPG